MENNEKIVINNDGENESIVAEAEKTSEHHHSHSSHHGHSHHHSHRRRSTKKERMKRFLKRYKYRVLNIVIAVFFAVILVALGITLDKRGFSDGGAASTDPSGGFNITDSSVEIEIPFFGEDVVLVSTGVEKYIGSPDVSSAKSFYKDYSPLGRLDIGKPVTLWYELKGIPSGCSVKSAELLVSEKEDFSSPLIYSLSSSETSVDVYNLKTGTKYYYRFIFSFTNGTQSGTDGSFKTAITPRILNVDGIGNIRDIGGWTTLSGKRVRQGLLYRGTEIDGLVNKKYTATAEGINTLLTVLGIRTEMDLRYENDNPTKINALGAGVKHNYYGSLMYSDVFTDNGKAAIRRIFSDLADKNNYPVFMHCTHGMDRTGTVCYLLEAILGMSEDDMMRDYQLSVFYHGDLWSLNEMNEFIGRLKAYDGATLQAKAEKFLLSAGVTSDEIASIREIFLEG